MGEEGAQQGIIADESWQDNNGNTPLHLAVGAGMVNLSEILAHFAASHESISRLALPNNRFEHVMAEFPMHTQHVKDVHMGMLAHVIIDE